MRIARTDSPSTDYATGIITPWFRTVAHLAFAGAIISQTEELTNAILEEVQTDLEEALKHLEGRIASDDSFVSIEVINNSENFYEQLNELLQLDVVGADANEVDRMGLLNNIQNLIHNATFICHRAESDIWGTDSNPGRLL